MNPLTHIPPKIRFAIYCSLFALEIVIGGAEVGYSTASLAYPLWLQIAHADFKYLIAAGFLTALSNVSPSKDDAGSTDPE